MNALSRPLVSKLEIWNSLVGLFGQKMPLGNGASLTFDHAGPPPESDQSPIYLIKTAQAPVVLCLETFPFSEATGVALELQNLNALPIALREALLDGVRKTLTDALPGPARTLILNVEQSQIPTPLPEEWIMASLDGGWGAAAKMRLGSTLDGFSALAADLTTADGNAGVVPGLAAHIPMPCQIALPGRTLACSVVRDLRPGDLILLEGAAKSRELLAATMTASLDATEENWTIKEVRMSETDPEPGDGAPQEISPESAESAASASIENADAAPEPAAGLGETELHSLADVPIRLSFVIQDHTVSLSDLQDLRKGAVLPFPLAEPDLGQPVRILANGRAIGAGNLIEIDGQSAVRISRIATD